MYTNFHTIYSSLKFDDIVKMNSMCRNNVDRNNLLLKNFQLLYKAYNGYLFYTIKVQN